MELFRTNFVFNSLRHQHALLKAILFFKPGMKNVILFFTVKMKD